MLLAVLQESHGDKRALPWLSGILSRPGICWPVSTLAFALLASDAIGEAGISASTAVVLEAAVAGLFAVGLMGPAVLNDRGKLVQTLFANRAIAFAGLISYGIFLWHLSIAGWLNGTDFVSGSPIPFVTLGAVTLAASIALGTASWYGIERPLMRRVRSVKAFSHPGDRSVGVPTRSEPPPPVAAQSAETA
jgi:peptidoglycan/LPS O-acetylase OafA/YrhL